MSHLNVLKTKFDLDAGELVPICPPRFLLYRNIESLEVSRCQYYALDPLSKIYCPSNLQIVDMYDERTGLSMRTILF